MYKIAFRGTLLIRKSTIGSEDPRLVTLVNRLEDSERISRKAVLGTPQIETGGSIILRFDGSQITGGGSKAQIEYVCRLTSNWCSTEIFSRAAVACDKENDRRKRK